MFNWNSFLTGVIVTISVMAIGFFIWDIIFGRNKKREDESIKYGRIIKEGMFKND